MTRLAALSDRTVIAVTGADRVGFLNGLVSNDVADAAPGRAIWAALLTAQGKWLADFFILSDTGRLLLDCEAAQSAMLLQRLQRYRLRADVALSPTSLEVYVAWDGTPGGDLPDTEGAISAHDPRLHAAGWRILAASPLQPNASIQDWDQHRLTLGLPDGSRDLEPEKTVLLEAGFDELNGISWTKGCYMGQELTARTRYRGLIKRRLLPVEGATDLPPPGTPVISQGREIGQMRSSLGRIGLATLRLDALGATEVRAGDVAIAVTPPDWAKLPEIA